MAARPPKQSMTTNIPKSLHYLRKSAYEEIFPCLFTSYATRRQRKKRWFHFFIPIDIMSGSRFAGEFLQFVRGRCLRRPQQEVQEIQLGDQTAGLIIIIRQTARHRGRFSTVQGDPSAPGLGYVNIWITLV